EWVRYFLGRAGRTGIYLSQTTLGNPPTSYSYRFQQFIATSHDVEAAPIPTCSFDETWTGSNGAGWPSAWTISGIGPTFDIQSNTGHVNLPAAGTGIASYSGTSVLD